MVRASRTAKPPAATTPVLNVMLLPATISEPRPPAPANTASVASPTVVEGGITKTYAFQPNGELVQSSVVIFLYKVVNDDFSTVGDVAALIK